MSLFIVDVEANGPYPPKYSMLEIGAVLVTHTFNQQNTFYTNLRPLPDSQYKPHIYKEILKYKHEDTKKFTKPEKAMQDFCDWVLANSPNKKPVMISDNNSFDWMFINYYFHEFIGMNPFGFSSRNLSDIFHGSDNNMFAPWKQYRKTKHTHNPVDDAIGNLEALQYLVEKRGFKI